MTVKHTTYYSSVERIVYELDESSVRDAVIFYLIDEGLAKNNQRGKFEFDWTTDEHERLIVEVTKVYEQRTGATKESEDE